MVTNQSVGANIRRMRLRAGISQAELARRLDVSRASVANWETGMTCPRLRTALALADALGCKAEDFMVG